MTDEFMDWAGLTPERWAQLMHRLNRPGLIACTNAEMLRTIAEDAEIGYREQMVIAFWLGLSQDNRNNRQLLSSLGLTVVSG